MFAANLTVTSFNCNLPWSIFQGVDVSGIRMVIVYGLPDTLSQLYQVCYNEPYLQVTLMWLFYFALLY